MIKRALDFVEDRTGASALLRRAFDEQIEGGVRIGHALGNALLVLFLFECVTGTFLALTYLPSTEDAWSSVFYIQEKIVNGWFIRGVHSYGAEAMLVVFGLHLLALVAYGGYKKPREFNWWLTLGLGGVILGFLLTGFRLPWDQHSYWALQVEMNIAAGTPLVGEMTNDLVAGGPTIGQQTLTRIYAAHVVLLPGAAAAIFAMLIGLRRRNGWPVPPWGDRRRTGAWFPSQLAIDLGFTALVIAVIVVLTTMTHGRELFAPAEPERDFPARPEWFLLPLYKLRMLLPHSMEMVATIVLPGIIATFLFALPFLDRKADSVAKRAVWLAPVLLIFAGMGALTAMSKADDAADEDFQEAYTAAKERAERSIVLARSGIPPEGPVEMLRRDPMTRGKEIYVQYCVSCHVLDGTGERKAPDHTGFGSRAWIGSLLQNPRDDHFFGQAEMDDLMPSQARLGEESLTAIAEFLFSLGVEPQDGSAIDEALVARAQEPFEQACLDCHTFRGEGDISGNGAPPLELWGTRTWIYRQIAHPEADTQYGSLNEMPPFWDQLSEHDLRMVTAYLRRQRFEEPDFTVTAPADDDD
jgi:ubiquinol-cytochrome c reductase cytochrome b subunit